MSKKATAKADYAKVLQLDPAVIIADDNIRYGLRPADVERMMESILDRGGVQEPVSVTVTDDGSYRLLKGFIRHAAVTRLNAEQAAGLTLPALVRPISEGVERLKTQIAENVARSALSPMDEAYSIKRLMDAGVSRIDIRKLFARAGTSKGAAVSPMSNSWVNLMLLLLELAPDIIKKIHEGRISATAAQELARVPEERRAAVLEKAEADAAAISAREEKDEERYLKAEQAQAKEAAKLDEAAAKVEEARANISKLEAMVNEKLSGLRVVQGEQYDPTDAQAKATYMERLKGSEVDVKAAQQLLKREKNVVAKALEARNKAEAALAPVEAKPVKGKSAVGPKNVKKAARADAATPEGKAAAKAAPKVKAAPKLTAADIRDAMKDIGRSENSFVRFMVETLNACFDGTETPKQTRLALEAKFKVKK